MTYLLYGSDTARSREKLNEIVEEYRRKHGDLNVHQFDAEEDGLEKIESALETPSLFSPKKLVIIKYISQSQDRGLFYALLENAKDDATVILWDRQLDQKTLSELKPVCRKIQEFRETKRSPLPEVSIFELGDTFFSSRGPALRSLLQLLHQGHDDFNLFSYLANHARTLAIVKYYIDRREPVAARHGIHPYVAKKAGSVARMLPEDAPSGMLKKFFEEDRRIKTGLAKPKDSLIKIILWV